MHRRRVLVISSHSAQKVNAFTGVVGDYVVAHFHFPHKPERLARVAAESSCRYVGVCGGGCFLKVRAKVQRAEIAHLVPADGDLALTLEFFKAKATFSGSDHPIGRCGSIHGCFPRPEHVVSFVEISAARICSLRLD